MNERRGELRKVKIVATLGPASASADAVEALARSGADVFRINCAHTRPEAIADIVALVRRAEAAVGHPLGVFADLAGPKLRIARDTPQATVTTGEVMTLGRPGAGANITVEGLDPVRECPPGSRILLNDGKVTLVVESIGDTLVTARVARGGGFAGGKGVNLPDVETSLAALTARDIACLEAALAAGIDMLSLSFVRRGEDVAALRREMTRCGRTVPVIAKIEKAQAVEPATLRAILSTSDAIMVARGDLGAETSPEQVPVLQKCILRAARALGVPAITATEMLESMIHEPRPTRAEAADVANAVFDGTDAVMLSGETAVGDHPALVVASADRIVREAERHGEFRTAWAAPRDMVETVSPIADAVAAAAAEAADALGAAAIVCFTMTGRTARLVARHRPIRPVLALTPRDEIARALALVWGVIPHPTAAVPDDHEAVVALAAAEVQAAGLAAPGEWIVVTHGAPLAAQPLTNLMRVHRV